MPTALAELREEAWDLSDLIPEPREPELARLLLELEREVAGFESQRDQLSSDLAPDALPAWLHAFEALSGRLRVLEHHGELRFTAHGAAALEQRNRVGPQLRAARQRIQFFLAWWQALSDADAERLLERAALSPDHRHFLGDQRRLRAFALDEPSERIVRLLDADGQQALLDVHSLLVRGLRFEIAQGDERRPLSRDALLGLTRSPDADLRRGAHRELFRVHLEQRTLLGQIYLHRARGWWTEHVALRGFPTPIAARNAANDLPDAVVQTVLEVVREHAGLFAGLYRLKARRLGAARLHRCDLYAPLCDEPRKIAYGEAVARVLEAFGSFAPRAAELAQRVFRERHIDSEVRAGKHAGAGCAAALPTLTPWVTLQFRGTLRDVAALAHELGHAVHGMLAGDRSLLVHAPSLPLAETASGFFQMLVMDCWLAGERDPAAGRELLAGALDDLLANVLRQSCLAAFEQEAHDAAAGGADLDALDALYWRGLAEQFGGELELPEEFRHEWLTLPQLYQVPFYSYAHAFGQLLALSLYERHRQGEPGFAARFLELLAAGGSTPPGALLLRIGVDLEERAFWRGGLAVIEGLVQRLEASFCE